MRHINRAFSGGGLKVSAATVSQASEDTDPAADPTPVLYRALLTRRDVFPLVPPPSEMARWAKEARVHKKLAPELLCSYHRGTVERAKVQN